LSYSRLSPVLYETNLKGPVPRPTGLSWMSRYLYAAASASVALAVVVVSIVRRASMIAFVYASRSVEVPSALGNRALSGRGWPAFCSRASASAWNCA